jgi:hypothetical protein
LPAYVATPPRRAGVAIRVVATTPLPAIARREPHARAFIAVAAVGIAAVVVILSLFTRRARASRRSLAPSRASSARVGRERSRGFARVRSSAVTSTDRRARARVRASTRARARDVIARSSARAGRGFVVLSMGRFRESRLDALTTTR